MKQRILAHNLQKTLLKRVFLLVRRKRHARVRSVFSSYQVMVWDDSSHIRYRWSYLLKYVLHLKSH